MRPPAALGVALVLLVAGCGGTATKSDGPDKATVACRGQWKDLGKQVRGNDQKTNPSALAERWNSVVATIDYYTQAATSKGCDEAISRQKAAITALTSYGTKLAPYDMELQLAEIRDRAGAYASGPTPSSTPTPKNKKKQKKPKGPPPPPAPSTVAAALKSMTTQAPVATQQQGPGWQQADVIELTDPAAVTKSVKDLAFLSTESSAWRSCKASLTLIKRALAANP